ncbi:MAG: hypothetical protein JWN03_1392 [Nocardia sp.]|nr:hypothetical protein [Nocardia sp.]
MTEVGALGCERAAAGLLGGGRGKLGEVREVGLWL